MYDVLWKLIWVFVILIIVLSIVMEYLGRIMVGYLLELPVVFAKKRKPNTMENMLVTEVFSFTKNQTYTVCVSKDYLQPGDKVLFIDDFLANGNAGKGMIDLVEKAGAELVEIPCL